MQQLKWKKQVKVPHFHVIDNASCIQAKSHPYVAKSRPHNSISSPHNSSVQVNPKVGIQSLVDFLSFQEFNCHLQ
jgi:hypothetical protein